MSTQALDELANADQRVLDLDELEPFLLEVAPEPDDQSLWEALWRWLWERLLDQEAVQNHWLETLAQWFNRYGAWFEYFFYATVILILLFLVYLLWILVSNTKFSKRRRTRAKAGGEVSQAYLSFANSDDVVVQSYVNLLRQFEAHHLVPQPFTLSPGEIARHLSAHLASHPIAHDFKAISVKLDAYLYGHHGEQAEALLMALQNMRVSQPHE